MFARLRAVVYDLAGLLRLPFSSALCTTLSRLVINVYKSLTAGTKLHVGTKGAPLLQSKARHAWQSCQLASSTPCMAYLCTPQPSSKTWNAKLSRLLAILQSAEYDTV